MSTENKKRGVLLGIFISIGLVIFLVGVFTLGGQQKTFSPSLTISALFDDVSGLQKGNNVWFSGVKIGTVQKISFARRSQVNVTMHIDKKAEDFIRKDAKVKIGSDGLIGNKILVIVGGTESAAPVENNDVLQAQSALSTEDILTTLQRNNENLIAITSNIKLVSEKLAGGQGTIGTLLSDKTLYNALTASVANLKTATHNSDLLTSSLKNYAARLQEPGSLASGLVSDTVILQQIQSASRELRQASRSANAFADQLQTAGNQLNNHDNTLGLLLYDTQTAGKLRTTLNNVNTGSTMLNDDLEAARHNIFLRGFFRKRAKQEAKDKKKQEADSSAIR